MHASGSPAGEKSAVYTLLSELVDAQDEAREPHVDGEISTSEGTKSVVASLDVNVTVVGSETLPLAVIPVMVTVGWPETGSCLKLRVTYKPK
jgi:hypothetical protein